MTNEKNNKQHLEEIIFKFFEGTASIEEQGWLQHWLAENSENTKQFDELKLQYHWFKKGLNPGDFNKEESWNRIKAGYYKTGYLQAILKKKQYNRRTLLQILIPAAAAVFVAFIAGFYINSRLNGNQFISKKLVYNEVSVPYGARSQITLSDGTIVNLNAGSRIRYPANFLRNSREVFLEGEAYFDVAKIPDKIFIVKTTDIKVKVYGTQFNLKSYSDENYVQTTLVEGSLSIEFIHPLKGRKPVYIKPNQSITYYKAFDRKSGRKEEQKDTNEDLAITPDTPARIVLKTAVDPVSITSWKDKEWVIFSEELDDLAIKLERRYNVKITFQDESLKKYKFSGTLKDETFEQVLKIIQISAPILFTVVDNQVTVKEDPLFRKNYDKMINSPK
jgi:transmembrane sensor